MSVMFSGHFLSLYFLRASSLPSRAALRAARRSSPQVLVFFAGAAAGLAAGLVLAATVFLLSAGLAGVLAATVFLLSAGLAGVLLAVFLLSAGLVGVLLAVFLLSAGLAGVLAAVFLLSAGLAGVLAAFFLLSAGDEEGREDEAAQGGFGVHGVVASGCCVLFRGWRRRKACMARRVLALSSLPWASQSKAVV